MARSKKLGFLKFEAATFAAAIIGFMVMYYFKYIDKYFLTVVTLMMSSMVFSANASIQAWSGKKPIVKLNLFLAALFSVAGLVFSIIFWSTGKLSMF